MMHLNLLQRDYDSTLCPSGAGISITASRFPSLDSSEIGNIAQSAIGQSSVLATPMQMALVAATVGNDGVMMQPKLVKAIVDKDQNVS